MLGVPQQREGRAASSCSSATCPRAVARARVYLPELLDHLASGCVDPSPVLDLELPLDQVTDGYAAMDGREAIKVFLAVS